MMFLRLDRPETEYNKNQTNISGWKSGVIHEEDVVEDVNLKRQRYLRDIGATGRCRCQCTVHTLCPASHMHPPGATLGWMFWTCSCCEHIWSGQSLAVFFICERRTLHVWKQLKLDNLPREGDEGNLLSCDTSSCFDLRDAFGLDAFLSRPDDSRKVKVSFTCETEF